MTPTDGMPSHEVSGDTPQADTNTPVLSAGGGADDDLKLPEMDQLWPGPADEQLFDTTPFEIDAGAFDDMETAADVDTRPPPVAPARPPAEPPAPLAPAASTPNVRDTVSQPGVVLPMSRNPIRVAAPQPFGGSVSSLDRLLRIAAALGASALYL